MKRKPTQSLAGAGGSDERTVAAERAAALDSAARVAARRGRELSLDAPAIVGLKIAEAIDNLPRDRSALDGMLAQARREQRREDAAWVEQCADKYYADEYDGRARIVLRIAAENLRAQED